MYDGLQSPGRNDECWCGSGKKYKKCHLDFDERLEELAEAGEEVPPRDLLKTPAEIEGIKRSAEVNIGVLDYVAERIAPGITTEQIDQWVHDYTVEHGAIPAPLDYEGFPKSVCTSVNEVVCHGIPSPDEVLREGDIVNIDCSTIKDDFFSDSSRMFCIGEVSPEAADLVRVTKEAVQVGLDAIKPWGHLGDIGAAVNAYAREHGYTVVREFGGHGIGLSSTRTLRELRHGSRHRAHSRAGAVLHHRAHDQCRCPGDRHDRPQRLDSPHRRSLPHSPVGSPARHHRRRLRAAQLVEVSRKRGASNGRRCESASVSEMVAVTLRSPYA